MATIGLDSLYYAKITEDTNGDETYGTPQILDRHYLVLNLKMPLLLPRLLRVFHVIQVFYSCWYLLIF
jgi:hypothetical protein